MVKNKIEYNELSKAKVTESRNIVVSACSKGGFTIAQQLWVKEDSGKNTNVFLKGAFHVDDVNGLYNIRDAVNLAIKVTEESGEDDSDWDEE